GEETESAAAAASPAPQAASAAAAPARAPPARLGRAPVPFCFCAVTPGIRRGRRGGLAAERRPFRLPRSSALSLPRAPAPPRLSLRPGLAPTSEINGPRWWPAAVTAALRVGAGRRRRGRAAGRGTVPAGPRRK